jgi:predicted nuclease with TOPRIM domain
MKDKTIIEKFNDIQMLVEDLKELLNDTQADLEMGMGTVEEIEEEYDDGQGRKFDILDEELQ